MTIVMCVFSIPTFALSMLEEDHSSEKVCNYLINNCQFLIFHYVSVL
jgi:hypothetical protein